MYHQQDTERKLIVLVAATTDFVKAGNNTKLPK